MGFWTGQWRLTVPAWIIYNVSLSHDANLGVFIRQNTMPSRVNYDFIDRLAGNRVQAGSLKSSSTKPFRVRRSTLSEVPQTRETSRMHYLNSGLWYIAIVNDRAKEEHITFLMQETMLLEGCPNDCTGQGTCSLGRCVCFSDFHGADCSLLRKPQVCSGHGEYIKGKCDCYPQWKGDECATFFSDCVDPACSGNGTCQAGLCTCDPGFTGEACEKSKFLSTARAFLLFILFKKVEKI
ncbi:Teneurin-4 [Cichlidogyrus casuarinus]|uniref:Teneurin-4 n=1 Tax=Cichlidogyrus casuarinus TaxID=1844966 RepID=A0ABD2PU56_9PLAT